MAEQKFLGLHTAGRVDVEFGALIGPSSEGGRHILVDTDKETIF